MSTPELYSAPNILNTLAAYISTELLDVDYLIGWQERNAVQTPDGWYFDWDNNYTAYMVDSTFSARFTAAKGLVSIVDGFPTEPRFIERPIAVAGPLPQHEVSVPALSLEVSPAISTGFVELGSATQWWNRTLLIEGFFRTRAELRLFSDFMAVWLQETIPFTVLRHDDGSLDEVGNLQFLDTVTETEVDITEAKQLVYHLVCNARLEYAA